MKKFLGFTLMEVFIVLAVMFMATGVMASGEIFCGVPFGINQELPDTNTVALCEGKYRASDTATFRPEFKGNIALTNVLTKPASGEFGIGGEFDVTDTVTLAPSISKVWEPDNTDRYNMDATVYVKVNDAWTVKLTINHDKYSNGSDSTSGIIMAGLKFK